jgi:hypothetical protein
MATVYPGALDDFTNPTASDSLNDPTVPHATQHADANDAIEAIQATLGVDPQGTESTVGDRIGALETTVDAETTGLVDRVDALETGLGDPVGSDLALNIAQVTADAADELVAGEAAGEVDDSAVATYFKFTIDSVEYGIPAYAINPPE